MKRERNPIIELLRFVFCLVIINYHFYSHYLSNLENPNYFSRGYLGDEFFFIVSGYYFAKKVSTIETSINSIEWGVNDSLA